VATHRIDLKRITKRAASRVPKSHKCFDSVKSARIIDRNLPLLQCATKISQVNFEISIHVAKAISNDLVFAARNTHYSGVPFFCGFEKVGDPREFVFFMSKAFVDHRILGHDESESHVSTVWSYQQIGGASQH